VNWQATFPIPEEVRSASVGRQSFFIIVFFQMRLRIEVKPMTAKGGRAVAFDFICMRS
jgi:hypothetical protein